MLEEINEDKIRKYHSEMIPFLREKFDPNSFRAIIERHQKAIDTPFTNEVLNPTTELGQLRYLHGKLKLGYQQED